jgi:hypothetical protein
VNGGLVRGIGGFSHRIENTRDRVAEKAESFSALDVSRRFKGEH